MNAIKTLMETSEERSARLVRERQEADEAQARVKRAQAEIVVLNAIKRHGIYWPGDQ